MDNKTNILLVEDRYEERVTLSDTLKGWGFNVTAVGDGARALEKFTAHNYNLVISDLKMPKMDGIGLLSKIKERENDVPVILISGYGTVDVAVKAMRLGALDFIVKPFPPKLSSTLPASGQRRRPGSLALRSSNPYPQRLSKRAGRHPCSKHGSGCVPVPSVAGY